MADSAQTVSDFAAALRAHAGYYCSLLDSHGPRLNGDPQNPRSGQLNALKLIGADIANVYVALDAALLANERSWLLSVARNLVLHDIRTGRMRPAEVAYQRILQWSEWRADEELTAATLNGLGNLEYMLSNYPRAIELHEQALELHGRLNDRQGLAAAYFGLGNASWSLGRYQQAHEFHQQALAVYRAAGTLQEQAHALNGIGNCMWATGDYSAAGEYYSDSLTLAQTAGDMHSVATAQTGLGHVLRQKGEFADSRSLYELALNQFELLGDLNGQAVCCNGIGHNDYQHLRICVAQSYYERSLSLFQQLGNSFGEAISLCNLGNVALHELESAMALELFERSYRMRCATGDIPGQLASLTGMAEALVHQLDFSRALDRMSDCLVVAATIAKPTELPRLFFVIAELLDTLNCQEASAMFLWAARSELQNVGAQLPALQQQLMDKIKCKFALGTALEHYSEANLAAISTRAANTSLDQLRLEFDAQLPLARKRADSLCQAQSDRQ